MAPGRRSELLDRVPERQELGRLLEDVRAGRSRVLVIRGDPGIGKTVLLDHCEAQASGYRVVRISGVESEMELPFAALHQLCTPVLDHLEALPPPQRTALRVAFALEAGSPPDPFLVALAVLGLLSEAAARRPLLCLVDDAQWLDRASARVLGFVARRLQAEAVALVAASRVSNPQEVEGLPELVLGGLPEPEARVLVQDAVPGRLDAAIVDRLIAETQGNPLALLELGRAAGLTQVTGEAATMLPERIERSFLEQLDDLPAEARLLLLVAAADPVGDPLVFWPAAQRLGIDPSAFLGRMQGLLSVGRRVTLRHPLVRSAAYRAASARERRAVHLALAEVTDPSSDSDRRAWHLAAAAPGPDEDVAAELERSAARAQARGGLAAAAAFLQQSVTLTPDPARRAVRALAAAQVSLHAGAFDAASGSLATAEAGELDEVQAARADLLRAQIALSSGALPDAPPLLLRAARRWEPLDLAVAREAYVEACGAAFFAGATGAGVLAEAGRAARRLPPVEGSPRAVDLLLDGLALLITEGRAAAAPTLLRAQDAFTRDAPIEEALRWGWIATVVGNSLWDNAGVVAICERLLAAAREIGALERLTMYMLPLTSARAMRGDVAEAAALIAETAEVTRAIGSNIPLFPALTVAVHRGDEREARELLAALRRTAERGHGLASAVADWTESLLCNGLGRHDLALEPAQRASTARGDFAASMRSLPELVEAAVRCGRRDVALDALERLVETTRPARTDYGLGVEARARALVAEGEEAETHFLSAIEHLTRARIRPDLARSHLLLGEHLRAVGRVDEARAQLRTASDHFVAMGMQAFAERTRRERVASGERVRSPAAAAQDPLTAQEAQIARLAADGLSNPEIGARLFLSPRTVEWHLGNVFAKLGVRTRRELRDLRPPAAN